MFDHTNTGKSESPDLKSFIQQFPSDSLDQKIGYLILFTYTVHIYIGYFVFLVFCWTFEEHVVGFSPFSTDPFVLDGGIHLLDSKILIVEFFLTTGILQNLCQK